MAKKKTSTQSTPRRRTTSRAETDEKAADHPQVQDAEEAVQRAREQLHKAQQYYHDVQRETVAKLESMRHATVGDVIDAGLECVKKYPGPSVLAAAVAGFFFGRLFRR